MLDEKTLGKIRKKLLFELTNYQAILKREEGLLPNSEDKRDAMGSAFGSGALWATTIASFIGFSILSKSDLINFFTQPAGYFTLAITLTTGVITGYFSRKSYLDELREQQQTDAENLLVSLEKLKKELIENTLLTAEVKVALISTWRKTQDIDDPIIKAKWRAKILKIIVDPNKKDKIIQLAKLDIQPKRAASVPENKNFEKKAQEKMKERIKNYNALYRGEPTSNDKSKLRRTALGSFISWFTTVGAIPGAALLQFTSGWTGFTAIVAAFSNPLSAIIFSSFLILGAAFGGITAYRKYFISERRHVIKKVQEAAAAKCEANEMEFERLKTFVDSPQVEEIWNVIHSLNKDENSLEGLAAKATMQAHFLADLLEVKNNPERINEFLLTWNKNNIIQEIHPTQKKGVDDLKEKEELLSTPINILPNSYNQRAVFASISSGGMWSATFISSLSFFVLSSVTLVALFATPPGWIILGLTALIGISVGIYTYQTRKQLLLEERENEVLELSSQLKAQFGKLQKLDNFQEKELLKEWWGKAQAIDDVVIRTNLQLQALKLALRNKLAENAQEFNHKIDQIVAQQNNLIAKQKQINNIDAEARQNTYARLYSNEVSRNDKAKAGISAFSSFITWALMFSVLPGLAVVNFGIGFIGLAAIGLALSNPITVAILAAFVLIGVTVGIISAVMKYREIINERKKAIHTAAVARCEANEIEFDRLNDLTQKNNLGDFKKQWEIIDKIDDYHLKHPGPLAAKAKIQSDFLKDLQAVKNEKLSKEKFYEYWNEETLQKRINDIVFEGLIKSLIENKKINKQQLNEIKQKWQSIDLSSSDTFLNHLNELANKKKTTFEIFSQKINQKVEPELPAVNPHPQHTSTAEVLEELSHKNKQMLEQSFVQTKQEQEEQEKQNEKTQQEVTEKPENQPVSENKNLSENEEPSKNEKLEEEDDEGEARQEEPGIK